MVEVTNQNQHKTITTEKNHICGITTKKTASSNTRINNSQQDRFTASQVSHSALQPAITTVSDMYKIKRNELHKTPSKQHQGERVIVGT